MLVTQRHRPILYHYLLNQPVEAHPTRRIPTPQILEQNFEGARHANQLGVCTLPDDVVTQTYAHMSSYPNARSKMICAVATAHLPAYLPHSPTRPAAAASDANSTSASSTPALRNASSFAYAVPLSATLKQQRLALGAALALSRVIRRPLRVPKAHTGAKKWRTPWGAVRRARAGRTKPFCSLFNAATIPSDAHLLSGRKNQCKGAVPTGVAAAAPKLKLQLKSRPSLSLNGFNLSLVNLMPPSAELCVGFEALLQLAAHEVVPHIETCEDGPRDREAACAPTRARMKALYDGESSSPPPPLSLSMPGWRTF